jgi:hypothetical protein
MKILIEDKSNNLKTSYLFKTGVTFYEQFEFQYLDSNNSLLKKARELYLQTLHVVDLEFLYEMSQDYNGANYRPFGCCGREHTISNILDTVPFTISDFVKYIEERYPKRLNEILDKAIKKIFDIDLTKLPTKMELKN